VDNPPFAARRGRLLLRYPTYLNPLKKIFHSFNPYHHLLKNFFSKKPQHLIDTPTYTPDNPLIEKKFF